MGYEPDITEMHWQSFALAVCRDDSILDDRGGTLVTGHVRTEDV